MANSETILSAQTHPGDSVATTVTGEKYKGDGYYGRSDGFHTIQYTLTGLIGTVNIQATLAINPTEDDWFTVYTQQYLVNETNSHIVNFTGNYVWVRANITDWTEGTIESIKLNH